MKSSFYLTLGFFIGLNLAVSAPALAATNIDVQNYHRAFQEIVAGHGDFASSVASHGRDPVLNKVLRGYTMALPGNDYSFDEMAKFIQDNPNWPGLGGIVSIAEQKIPANASPTKIADWYSQHPPVTLSGFYRYADSVAATGDTDTLNQIVRNRWVNTDFSEDDQRLFVARYSTLLDSAAHWEKLDRLLWKGDFVKARRVYPYVEDVQRLVAESRIALATHSRDSQGYLSRVPTAWTHDQGLQFELLRWYVSGKYDDRAVDILLHAPEAPSHSSAWWELRQIEIRRVMDLHDYDLAYRLSAAHGTSEGKDLIQAEFLAGWLALRYLNQPANAEEHFQALLDAAKTPISRARASYWLGRTYEVLGDKDSAEQSYEDAATYSFTYYGQLATTRLYSAPTIKANPEPQVPAQVRSEFENRDLIAAITRLNAIGETDRTRIFYKAAMDAAKQRAEFILLAELGYKLGRADYAIDAAKAANQKNIVIGASGYPTLKNPPPAPPETALVNGLVRQESMFNATAQSPASAVGLTQIMPGTAKDMARHLGISYRKNMLTDTAYNLRLGSGYLQELIDKYRGSYILALAGYNAGPGRVNDWLSRYGDPRDENVDAIDWIEMIPVSETRNYVQRIIENLQVYRARKSSGGVPLLILSDLKR